MRKKAFWLIGWALVLVSCRCLAPDPAFRYDPIGPAVLEATRQLSNEFPEGPPADFSGEAYKDLLQKHHYDHFYSVLKPYQVQITIIEKAFIVRVYKGPSRILIDWSETEGMIDCWCYKGECKDDWLHHRSAASDDGYQSEFTMILVRGQSAFWMSGGKDFGSYRVS